VKIKTNLDATFGVWKVEGHPRLIEVPLPFWDDILNVVMGDFVRLPWGGPELGGVLFGTREAGCLRIVAYRPLECEHAHGPAFELSEKDEAGLVKLLEEARKDRDLAGLEPVGWYFSKYHWLSLNPCDTEVYDRYFPKPWQVAMVFLRGKGEPCQLGFFFRHQDGSIRSSLREFTAEEAGPEMVEPEPAVPKPAAAAFQPEPAPVSTVAAEETEAPATGSSLAATEEEGEDAGTEILPEAPGEEAAAVDSTEVTYFEPEEEPVSWPPVPAEPERAAAPRSFRAFFGLERDPFPQTSQPHSPYWILPHREILGRLLYGVRSRKGLMVLTGEAGTGKTTMLGSLGDLLVKESVEFALLLNSRITSEQLYEMIAYDLDLRCGSRSGADVRNALGTLLLEQAKEDRTTALIVDDAHSLEQEVLEEIGRFDELQNRQGRLFQVVLAGLPELANRMAKAGQEEQSVFSRQLTSEIHARSGGVPRVINAICENVLERCFAVNSRVATLDVLDQVTSELRIGSDSQG
jgi:general secretion pathway protein A